MADGHLCNQIRAGQLLELRPPRWCNWFGGNSTACKSAFVRENPLKPEVWECRYLDESESCHTGAHVVCEMPPPPPSVPAPAPPPCSNNFEGCTSTRCCIDAAFGCFRHTGTGHPGADAVCLPLNSNCSVQSVIDGYRCPGWEACARPYGNCVFSGCCEQLSDKRVFECLKRPSKLYAQCRPAKPGSHAHSCTDSDEWLCPGWSECAAPFGDCSTSHCCMDREGEDFGCFKRPYSAEAQCRPFEAGCMDTDEWLCPGWDRCSDPDHACTRNHCCNHKDFTCYLDVATGAGRCLRTGTCKQQLRQQQPSTAVAEVVPGAAIPGCVAVNESTRFSPPPPPPPLSPTLDIYEASIRAAMTAEFRHIVGSLNTSVALLLVSCVVVTALGTLACCALWRQLRKQRQTLTSTMMSEAFSAAHPHAQPEATEMARCADARSLREDDQSAMLANQ